MEQRMGVSHLFAAAGRGDSRELRRLLAIGAEALERNSFGAAAPVRGRASRGGRPEGGERSLPVSLASFTDEGGVTALMAAAMNGWADCVELLLPVSNADAADTDGWTALMWAAFRGKPRCVERLLPVSDAKVRAKTGQTALMLAAESGLPECVELLLPVSDALARDNGGLSAADHARRGGGSEVSARLDGVARSEEERRVLALGLSAETGKPPAASARRRI